MTTGALFIVLGVVAFIVTLLGAIALTFRMHDPERARAFVVVKAGEPFELALPGGSGGTLWFRFHIDGDTDNSYDLLVRGEIEDGAGGKRGFAVRTDAHSTLPGASDASDTYTSYAGTTTSGSFELAKIEASDRRVHGTVASNPTSLLTVGWVYLR